MKVEFHLQDKDSGTRTLVRLDVYSDEIEALSPMPLEMLVDRMHGSLVCFAARKGKRPTEYNQIRPLICAEGEPVALVAQQPTLQGLIDAIAADEISPDW